VAELLWEIRDTDNECIAAFQGMIRLLAYPDNATAKHLMMVGFKRAGHGMIARMLKAMAGLNSVINPGPHVWNLDLHRQADCGFY
jgi:hypothetical protein